MDHYSNSVRPMQIVWFKRDLRLVDHAPLADAARAGPVLPLYVVEPGLWQEPDASARQYAFLIDSLSELRRDLANIGLRLVVRTGDVCRVLEDMAKNHRIGGLWSHEETGNGWTFTRDKQVAVWCGSRGVPWIERVQSGVIRRLGSRDGWAARWEGIMGQPQIGVPIGPIPVEGIASEAVPSAQALGMADDPCPGRQPGGRAAGLGTLDSFLTARGQDYRFAMSSPVSAVAACSRLSPHLAFGTLSLREVTQATRARLALLRGDERARDVDAWRKSLVSFSGRLHWHCHFMQKLESQPGLEFTNLHRAYDGMRPAEANPQLLAAWSQGQTGFPFVDACMRSLLATGWLNFRMRAMLVSFASYQLWLPWRPTGLHLARMFTDYEPGIHWPQVQMQSGTTGINTIRMYNPVKQGYDQDPRGVFVRRWVPELADLPDAAIHEPWRFPQLLTGPASLYPVRVVDHITAAREARDRVWSVRGDRRFRAAADVIQDQHGSRKSGIPFTGQKTALRKPRAKKIKLDTPQFEFDL